MATNIANLQVEIGADIRDLQRGLDTADRDIGSFAGRAERTLSNVGDAIRDALITFGVAAVGSAASRAAIEWESAFAGVRKTVNATDAQLAELERGLRRLGTSIDSPVAGLENASIQLAQIAEAAGQLGVAADDLLAFTETVGMLGMSTNLAGEEAAVMLAQFANITDLDLGEMRNGISNIERLGAVIVELGNNLATTERDIVEFGQRLAGAGAAAGFSEAEILAIGGALASVGMNAEAGGTAFSRVFNEMTRAAALGGVELQHFARVAGMSAQEFADTWSSNPARALEAFITGLGELDAAAQLQALEDLGLTEVRVSDALRRMAGNSELLSEALRLANNEWEESDALVNEANQRFNTTRAQMNLLRNNLTNVAVTLGQMLLPGINMLVGALVPLLQTIADANPLLIKLGAALALIAIGPGPILGTLSPIGAVLAPLAVPLAVVVGGFIALREVWERLAAPGTALSRELNTIGGQARRLFSEIGRLFDAFRFLGRTLLDIMPPMRTLPNIWQATSDNLGRLLHPLANAISGITDFIGLMADLVHAFAVFNAQLNATGSVTIALQSIRGGLRDFAGAGDVEMLEQKFLAIRGAIETLADAARNGGIREVIQTLVEMANIADIRLDFTPLLEGIRHGLVNALLSLELTGAADALRMSIVRWLSSLDLSGLQVTLGDIGSAISNAISEAVSLIDTSAAALSLDFTSLVNSIHVGITNALTSLADLSPDFTSLVNSIRVGITNALTSLDLASAIDALRTNITDALSSLHLDDAANALHTRIVTVLSSLDFSGVTIVFRGIREAVSQAFSDALLADGGSDAGALSHFEERVFGNIDVDESAIASTARNLVVAFWQAVGNILGDVALAAQYVVAGVRSALGNSVEFDPSDVQISAESLAEAIWQALMLALPGVGTLIVGKIIGGPIWGFIGGAIIKGLLSGLDQDALVAGLTDLLNNAGERISQSNLRLEQVIAELGVTLGVIWNKVVQPVIERIQTAFGEFVEAFADVDLGGIPVVLATLGGAISTFGLAVGSAVGNVIANVLPSLGEFLESIISLISKIGKGDIAGAMQQLIEALLALGRGIVGIPLGIAQTIADLIGAILNFAGIAVDIPDLGEAFGRGMSMIGNALQGLSPHLATAGQAAQQLVTIFLAFVNNIPGLVRSALLEVSDAVGGVLLQLNRLMHEARISFEAAKVALGLSINEDIVRESGREVQLIDLAQKMRDQLQQAVAAGGPIVLQTDVSWILNELSTNEDAREVARRLGQIAGSDILDALRASVAQGDVTNINLLANLGLEAGLDPSAINEILQPAGLSIVDGVVQGIQDNRQLLLDEASNMITGLEDRVMTDLQAGSPSMRAWEWALSIMEGLGLGIADNMALLEDPLIALVDKMTAASNNMIIAAQVGADGVIGHFQRMVDSVIVGAGNMLAMLTKVTVKLANINIEAGRLSTTLAQMEAATAGAAIPKMQAGGLVHQSGLHFLHEGERVLTRTQNMQLARMTPARESSGMTVNLTTVGQDPYQVMRMIRRAERDAAPA